MTDPWDDVGRGGAGFVVTGAGLRVPVAAPSAPGGWPGAEATGTGPVTATEARYRGVGPKGYRRSDPRLREQVCERLLLDPYLDASRIVVRVSKGRVALSGRVLNERMRSAAVAAAASVTAGAVDDALGVDPGSAGRPSRVAAQKGSRGAPKARKRGGTR